jgi:hypothetical protein
MFNTVPVRETDCSLSCIRENNLDQLYVVLIFIIVPLQLDPSLSFAAPSLIRAIILSINPDYRNAIAIDIHPVNILS